MKEEHIPMMMTLLLFAMGAVAVILYQHASSTNTIIGAITGAAPNNAPAGQSSGLGTPASLAGTPTIGQSGTSQPPAVVPLQIQPGYLLQ